MNFNGFYTEEKNSLEKIEFLEKTSQIRNNFNNSQHFFKTSRLQSYGLLFSSQNFFSKFLKFFVTFTPI